MDFKNPETVKALTKCCLHKDFNLEVELPRDKLLPTIPLRLNYLHWIEDLLKYSGVTDEITGVDIGCGASCVYCLLAVRMNPSWSMFALEIDEENLKHANGNIARNCLEEKVIVIAQEDSPALFERLFIHDPRNKSFCVCNPPFYSSKDEVIGQNRTGKRKAPNSFHSGSNSELVTDGGELGFAQKILNESLQLHDKIEIYSTMLGCKKNLQKLFDRLREKNVESFTTTEFVQGKTMRWGIAWSFKHNLKSFKNNNETSKKPKHVLSHTITSDIFEETARNVRNILISLKIEIKEVEEKIDKCHRWELSATENTWLNQRRKRRADQLNCKKSSMTDNEKKEVSKIGFELRNVNESAQLQMFFISGSMDKDCVNQILQFLKNKLK